MLLHMTPHFQILTFLVHDICCLPMFVKGKALLEILLDVKGILDAIRS